MYKLKPALQPMQEMIASINNSEMAMPDFQRKYEWKLDAVKKLLDSVLHGFPSGSLLFLNNNNEFSLKGIENAPQISDDSVKTLILDGQQRLTSLYQVLYNKHKSGLFYINLRKLHNKYNEVNGSIADIDFEELIEVKKRNTKAPDTDSITDYLPFSLLIKSKKKESFNFQRNAYKDRLQNRDEDPDYIYFIGNTMEEIIDPIFEYEFPVIELPSNLDMPAICRIFETLNNTGKNLNSFDICVAKFSASGINIRKMLDAAIEEKDDLGIDFKYPYLRILFGEEKYKLYLLQIIALLSDKPHTQNTLSKELTVEMIMNLWVKTLVAINQTLKWMDDFGACTSKNLSLVPYTPTIVIISAALVESGYIGGNMNSELKKLVKSKVREFFFYTALALKYGDAASTQTKKDFELLSKWFVNSEEKPPFLCEELQWYPKKLLSMNGFDTNSAIIKMLRCVMNNRNPKDFRDDGIVMSFHVKSDLHHLFPSDTYKNASQKGYNINSIFNLTYISRDTNQSIGNRRTCDYIDRLIASSHMGQESVFKEIMADHYINEDTYKALYEEDFDGFLEKRSEEILRYLKGLNLNVKMTANIEDNPEYEIKLENDFTETS